MCQPILKRVGNKREDHNTTLTCRFHFSDPILKISKWGYKVVGSIKESARTAVVGVLHQQMRDNKHIRPGFLAVISRRVLSSQFFELSLKVFGSFLWYFPESIVIKWQPSTTKCRLPLRIPSCAALCVSLLYCHLIFRRRNSTPTAQQAIICAGSRHQPLKFSGAALIVIRNMI